MTHEFTTNESSTGEKINGGTYCFSAQGDFDGGTLKLQWSQDGTTFTDVDGASLTASGVVNIESGPFTMRFTLTGATSPDLVAQLNQIR